MTSSQLRSAVHTPRQRVDLSVAHQLCFTVRDGGKRDSGAHRLFWALVERSPSYRCHPPSKALEPNGGPTTLESGIPAVYAYGKDDRCYSTRRYSSTLQTHCINLFLPASGRDRFSRTSQNGTTTTTAIRLWLIFLHMLRPLSVPKNRSLFKATMSKGFPRAI